MTVCPPFTKKKRDNTSFVLPTLPTLSACLVVFHVYGTQFFRTAFGTVKRICCCEHVLMLNTYHH